MALPLLEQLARHLNVSRDQAGAALFDFVEQLKADINNNKRAEIRGVGTLHATDEAIRFRPDAGLSMMVNNRFAALETETVQVAFKTNPPAEDHGDDADGVSVPDMDLRGISGDALPDFDEALPNLDDLAADDTLIGDSLDAAFWDGLPDHSNEHPLGESSEPPFEEADFSVLHPSSNLANDITNSPESSAAHENGAIPMKEDDPKSPLFSKEDGRESEEEWSPFFEELEGVEFEVDSPLDIDDTVWDESNPPKPPASPFAGERAEEDEFFFESERESELFGASFDDDMREEATWASSPLEDAPFFEDSPGGRKGRPDPLSDFGDEDELFSPAMGSAGGDAEDALFSEDELFRSAHVAEADETIFLPPDARQGDGRPDRSSGAERLAAAAAAAPAATASPAEASPSRADRRPYERRRSGSGNSMLWLGLAGLVLLIAAGGYAYMKGMLPFGPGATQEAPAPTAARNPAPAPVETPAETNAETPADGTSTDPGAATAPAANTPAPASTAPTGTPAATAPRGFVEGRGGWTIVVSSRESMAEAEALANRYAQLFANEGFPVDILRTDDFGTPRFRVGVGQFGSRQAATTAVAQYARSLPGDAWVISIPR
ncbi:MAG: SPOR domain-containing protein [Rhodothermales bacterium]